MGPSPPKGAEGALGFPLGPFGPLGRLKPLGSLWAPLGPWGGAPVSRNDKVASREIGGGAGIAGACKQVGGYARSVDESKGNQKDATG